MGILKRISCGGLNRNIDSKGADHIFLEKLEPRILLSGDGLLNLATNPLEDPLLDNKPLVVQNADLLYTDAQVEEQVSSELSDADVYKPLLTLPLEQAEDDGQIVSNAELTETDILPYDLDITLQDEQLLAVENYADPENITNDLEESSSDLIVSAGYDETTDQLTETLLAANPPPASDIVNPLNEADLNSILDEAIVRWMASGLVSDAGVFDNVSLVIDDLPIGVLGQAENGIISIDITADGHGWFVDATPADDSEFILGNDGCLIAIEDGPAAGRMDLLTVVLHELGHFAGFGHTDTLANNGSDVMRYFINTDVRLSVNAPRDSFEPGFTLDAPAFLLDEGANLNDVIDELLATYFDPAYEYPDSYEFSSSGGQIPNIITVGTTLGGGADLELQDVILTFSGLEYDGSWTGWISVEATSAILFPGLLDIMVVDDEFDPTDPEDDNDDDSFAVEGTIYLAEGPPYSYLNLDDLVEGDIVKLGWPKFLGVKNTELKLEFSDFRENEDQNFLHLSVDLAGFDVEAVVIELSIGGSASVVLNIEEVEDDASTRISLGSQALAMKAALATAMGTGLGEGECSGYISGEIFKVGSLSAGFIYGSVDPDGIGPEGSVTYLAVRGSFSIGAALACDDGDGGDGDGGGGFGGFGFAFAISELGPLHFFAYVDYPIVLEPVSGLAISSMGLGIMFNETIEGLQTDTDFTIEAEDVSVSLDGTTVTLIIDGHDFEVGDEFRIRGAENENYNGDFTVIARTVNTITYEVATNPGIFEDEDPADIIRLTIKDPLDLEDSGLESGVFLPEGLNPDELQEWWKDELEGKVKDQIEKGGNVWARLFDEVVLGGRASLSFDPRIPDWLMSFDVRFLLGLGLGINTDPILQIFLNGEMSLLAGTVSFSNTRLYADLSDLFSGEGKFLYLQTQGELDVPVIGGFEPLLVYRGWVSFETFLVGTDILDASVIDDTASGYWTINLVLDDTSGYSAGDNIAIFDSNPFTFGGTYEIHNIVGNTIIARIYCDLDGENGCSEEEITATNPGTWVSGESSAKIANKDDLGGGFRISLGGGVDLNIPGINADFEPILVTTLTLETIEDDLTVSFIVPPDSAQEEFRIELSFAVALSETLVGNIAEAAGLFVVALDVEDNPGAPVDEFIVIYGAAELTTELEFLENIGLYMHLEAFLRINSGEETSITLPGETTPMVLPADSFLIRFEGKVDFRIDFNLNGEFAKSESVFEIEGIFVLEFSPGGFNAAVFRMGTTGPEAAVLRLGPQNFCFIEFRVFAFLAIRDNGFAAHLALSADAALPLGLASISADAVFIVNTTGEDVDFVIPAGADGKRPDIPDEGLTLTIPGAAPKYPSDILAEPRPGGQSGDISFEDLVNGDTSWYPADEAGAYGVVFLRGELNLLSLLGLDVSGFILLSEQVMSLELNFYAGLNFLGLVEASAYGHVYFSSEGEFEVEVWGGVQLGPDGFNISGNAHLWIRYLNDELDVSGSLSGSVEIFWIEFDIFELGVSYNSATGDIKLSVGPVPVPAIGWYCFWGICVPYPTIKWKSYSFTVGNLTLTPPEIPPPPVHLGYVNGEDILVLYVGPDAAERNLMVDEKDEEVLIEYLSGNSVDGEDIRITMFGHSEDFEDVHAILIPDMADGQDSVEIRAGVTIPVEAHLGDDDDILISYGSGIVTAYGDEDNDHLEGGSANDQLFGGAGKDTIDGKKGNDWIEGGGGADVLIGGAGNDTIMGGDGVDLIAGDLTLFPPDLDPPDLVADSQDVDSGGWNLSDNGEIEEATVLPHISVLGTGNGTFDYYSFTVTGSDQRGIFDIDAENFNTQLFLYDSDGNLLTDNDDDGSDPGNGTSGASLIEYEFSEAGTYIIGVGKYASFNVVGQDDVGQIGGNAPDVGNYYTLHISLEGHALNPEGTDPVSELEPNQPFPPVYPDSFVFQTMASAEGGEDILDGGDGADVIFGGSGNDQINGGAGEDLLIGDDGIVTFSKEGMAYELTDLGYSGNDIIDGSAGNDTLYGQKGEDTLYGGEGDDDLYGDEGDDYLEGGIGNDCLFGGADNDILDGGADNDTLFGQKGEDILLGGNGDDFLYGDTDEQGTETDRNILLGDDGTIMVNGSVTVSTSGQADGGADTIYGNGGADIVMGGASMDMIHGDAGDDILLGDTGIIMLDNGSPVYVDTEDEEYGGSDTVHGNMGNDIIIGGLNSSSDILYGDAGDDIILGDNGFIDFSIDADFATLDLIRSATDGLGGNDYIYGNAGDDVLIGGTGGDEIQGGDDPDILIGDNADIFLSGFVPGSLTILGSAVNEIISTDTGPSTGGADIITGNEASDIIIGGVNGSSDTLYGNDGDDVILGDNGLLDFAYSGDTDLTTLDLICSFTDGLGGDDIIYGNAGEDVLIGGSGGDRIDGNGGKDLILGDNGVLTYMNGDTSNPRFRVLEGTVMYGEADGVDDGLLLIDRDQQFDDPAGIPQWAIWEVMLSFNSGGADYIAGGPDNDQIFGQGGNDIIQGDGNIDPLADVNAYRDAEGLLVVSPSVEDQDDGDDYIEGNDGDDIIFGNLGQDDIIGGSSGLFGLDTVSDRTDGEDMIFGGAGTDISRNDEGDASHSRDSDMILGDNGNIFRLVSTNGIDSGGFLAFNYDDYDDEKIIVRGTELLDYTPGGIDYDEVSAANDIGEADEIHGESGDDFLYGMKGNDIIFGEGQDDDIIGGYGNDWISGGTGDDGVLGDDGRIYTSRNGTDEPLYGIGNLAGELDKEIGTPDKKQQATINVSGQLKKSVNLTPFKLGDPEVPQYMDDFDPEQADDILFGGWGNDFLHGGDGDDAISGAEALAEYYDKPVNDGDVLKFGVYRTGEFGAYNRDDPLSKVYWDPDTGEFGGPEEFLLNFDHTEGPADNDDVNTDGDDVIFGDLGNDWLVGGTGRDHIYGGRGSDLLNADDNLETAGGTNSEPNGSESSYEDIAYGGAGPDVLIANIRSDRLIDWVGDFNLYALPYTSFGVETISRNLKPKLFEFLYDLSKADGADQTIGDSGDPRNGEPNGELGLVVQKDPDWEDQQTPEVEA